MSAFCRDLCLLRGKHRLSVGENLARGEEGSGKEQGRRLKEQESKVDLRHSDRASFHGVGYQAGMRNDDPGPHPDRCCLL